MGQQFTAGTPVYDVNGAKVGTVSEQGVQGDNLVVQKGFFFPHDYFVPLRAIRHVDADGLYLNVSQDDVTNQTFDNVGTQQAETGRGHVHKDVVGEQQAVNVLTTFEEPHLERVPAWGGASDVGPDAFTDRDIDIPLRGEEVVAKKEARVAEEVRLRKQQVTETQRVGDTVRKERIRIEGGGIDKAPGDVSLESDTTSDSQKMGDAQQQGGV